jgi:eukaryotic-like serine/threonine-protein kinase
MPSLDKDLWQSLSPLLDKALDLEGFDRDELIAHLDRESPALAAALREVLADHERLLASPFLQLPLDIEGGGQPSLAGYRIGAYTLERPIGAGGMGAVWLARRSDGRFEGAAAVKLLNLALGGSVGEERFRREGSLLARVAHPNIARLLDAGVTAAGQPYLVLEYVEGLRIDRYAAEHRLPIRARLDVFLQVADAVAHAHANLVVHRDLKPSNILVDSSGRVKLLDFGIATLIADQSTAPQPTVTLAGRALTPEYAAPEQATGASVTTATDVYAMGVLLYQLLVGRHPTAPDGASDAVILWQLADVDPARPSDMASRLRSEDAANAPRILDQRATTRERLVRACRGDLDTIVGKALKKTPVDRYQTVTAFADDVRRHLRQEPIAARPDSAWYRWRKFAARRRLELGAAAAVVLALVVGAGIAVRQARASAAERDRALEQLRRAEAVNDLSAFLLSEARPGRTPISNAELLARGESVIDRRFANDTVLRTHMLLMLADRYHENQQFEPWRRVLARAHADARGTSDPVLRAQATCAWAKYLLEQENARDALTTIDGAQRLLGSSEHADVAAYCALQESRAAGRVGDTSRAVRAAGRAVTLETARGAPANRRVSALETLATAHSGAGEFARSDEAYRRAGSLIEGQGLEGTLQFAVVLNNWSAMLQGAGQQGQAVALAERAVRIARLADSENGASLTMLTTWASALSATGNFTSASAALDEALIKSRAAGSASRLLNTLGQAVVAATEAGDVARGARLFAEAGRALAPDAPPLLKGIVAICAARVALASGDAEQAVAITRRALASLAAASPNQASLLPTQTFLARSLNANGQFGDALGAAERSLEVARARLGGFQYSSTVGSALLEKAVAHRGLGQVDAARRDAIEASEHLRHTLGSASRATERAETLRSSL